ncbi:MAG TPA: tRNA (adenosine(37)-N6)-dimethylallyltransferase MiaA [Acidimicrobiia bacterium]|nr:tRNA (adenosine(37)-N6)-dimethylallyltransferase MiaA [Acidimicrobiia bacterium]
MLGPTASGKTEMAIKLAGHLGAEIISVDSMQVYRGMDIGTAKPTVLERAGIVHHLIDVADPSEEFSVAAFRRLGRRVLSETEAPAIVISGGSGLHFRALVDPLSFAPTDPDLRGELESRQTEQLVTDLLEADPGAAAFVDVANSRRVIRAVEIYQLTGETPSTRAATAAAEDVRRYVPEVAFEAIGLDPGAGLEDRIDVRLRQMREAGLVDEVRSIAPRMGRTARNAVGYREVLAALNGEVSMDQALELASVSTKKLARKQRTWFQRDPRIRWIPWIDDPDQRLRRILETFD